MKRPATLGGLRRLVPVLWIVLLSVTAAPTAQAQDIKNEFRITAYPSYPITDKLTGFGYVGLVYGPNGPGYTGTYLGTGTFYRLSPLVQLWAGLISVYTNQYASSNTEELRPFVGVKFMWANSKKWRYYNWTRYELRLTDTLDTGQWSTVSRVRNQTRIEIPLASVERAWTPKTWYVLADVEPIWTSSTGKIDPLRLRAGLGRVVSNRLLVEFQYYAQFTQPGAESLTYTSNVWRLNFKIITKGGIWSFLDGDMDD